MIAAEQKTGKAKRPAVTPEPLRAAIEADKWYWTSDIAKSFKISRDTLAEMKRVYPDHVGRSRNGDILQGIAVIQWLAGKRSPQATT